MKEVLELVGGKVRVKEKKRSKYRNVGVKDPVDGYFHSTSEHKRWKALQLLQRAGKIRNLQRQTRHKLTVNGIHICDYDDDYSYEYVINKEANIWTPVVEDWKSKATNTRLFKVKQRLMKACYGIDILVTGEGT